MSAKIRVVGSGIIGLSTAIQLLKAGYEVHIVSEQTSAYTTSALAAAIWMPFELEPRSLVNEWSASSYEVFEKQAQLKTTGVSMVDYTVLLPDESAFWWRSALPEGACRKASASERPRAYDCAYVVRVPLVETPIYLPYLEKQFLALGGTLEQRKVYCLEEEVEQADVLVNCTGLGAAALTGDLNLYPIKGHIVKIDPVPKLQGICDDYMFGEDSPLLAYVIPRSDCTVLGGTTEFDDSSLDVNTLTTAKIIAACQQLSERLSKIRIQETVVGLRPGRKELRLERDAHLPIIHNYGHGGGGYTVCWGCAAAVESLVRSF